MSYGRSCGCGETPARVAVMSRTLSQYRNVPTIEIEQNISWLSEVKQDCDFKIHMLMRIKEDRERTKKWRDDINTIAQQFYDIDALHLDFETRTEIVRQRLGCDRSRAEHIATGVTKWAERQKKKMRDNNICTMYQNGHSAIEIAKKHEISRQQVYNIIKDNKPKFMK